MTMLSALAALWLAASPAEEIAAFVPDRVAQERLIEHLAVISSSAALRMAATGDGDRSAIRARIAAAVAENLAEKRALPPVDGKTFPLSSKEIERTVIDYECWKAETFVTSGVFPKRYFGYFDRK